MVDCLFCKIVAGEVPSEEVATSELTYAFRDTNPAAPVHVLVVPRTHITDASEVSATHGAIVAEMLVTAKAVADATEIGEGGYRLVFNVGDDALNTIPHLHLHVIGGKRMDWPPG